MSALHLYRKASFFNPQHLIDPRSGREREIRTIHLFNESGSVWNFNWFVENDGYTAAYDIVFEDLTIKFAKEATPSLFAGDTAFFTTKKEPYHDEIRVTLYLPLNKVKGVLLASMQTPRTAP
jgi:hypothetical protein